MQKLLVLFFAVNGLQSIVDMVFVTVSHEFPGRGPGDVERTGLVQELFRDRDSAGACACVVRVRVRACVCVCVAVHLCGNACACVVCARTGE